MSLLSRYMDGDIDSVWDVLLAADISKNERSEADLVSREAARRLSANSDRMILHLMRIGYRFEDESANHVEVEDVDVVPAVDWTRGQLSAASAQMVTGRLGAGAFLPTLLKACILEVGDVSLMGSFQGEDLSQVDPYEWSSTSLALNDALFPVPPRSVEVDFVGDSIAKSGYSGGSWVMTVDPSQYVDVQIRSDDVEGEIGLLGYFRRFMEAVGFPHLSPDDELWQAMRLEELKSQLLPV